MVGNPAIRPFKRTTAFCLAVTQDSPVKKGALVEAVKRRSRFPSSNGKMESFCGSLCAP